jgi:hypothetical protein
MPLPSFGMPQVPVLATASCPQRTRLARRSVVLTAGLLAANTLTAAVPAALLNATFQAALTFAAANAIAGGAASAQALTLS